MTTGTKSTIKKKTNFTFLADITLNLVHFIWLENQNTRKQKKKIRFINNHLKDVKNSVQLQALTITSNNFFTIYIYIFLE